MTGCIGPKKKQDYARKIALFGSRIEEQKQKQLQKQIVDRLTFKTAREFSLFFLFLFISICFFFGFLLFCFLLFLLSLLDVYFKSALERSSKK